MKTVLRNLAQTPSIFKPMLRKQLTRCWEAVEEMLRSSWRGCGREKVCHGRR